MAQQHSGCKTLLKFGCFGCLGLLVLLLVVAGVVYGIAWSAVQNEEVEKRELSQIFEAFEPVDAEDLPLEVPSEFVVPQPSTGRIVLDLRHTKFDVVPAAPGEPLQVKAEFDTNNYDLSESFTEAVGEEGWIYELEFNRTTDSYALTVLKELLGGTKPRVKIYLPRDVPFDLEASFLQGGAEVELGGLWLVNADIEFLQGGGALEISEPLREPAEYLSIDFTQGGGALERLGNASARVLEVSFSMGGGFVDLRGEWRNDAEIEIEQSMGGVTLQLPRNVTIRGLRGHDTGEPAQGEEELPVLRFSTSSSMGELEILK